ncbi:hypothetical protein K445DRAFT_370250 [Daldinia sp. EC12]|nr:hypothetical protein K445DRAFT_370250 [Daldinia sp. EC12]
MRIKLLSWDDFSIFIAFIITLALICQITWAVIDEGQGQHMSDVTRSQFEMTAKSLLANEALWALINVFVRLSALGSIATIFHTHRPVRIQARIFMGISIAHAFAAILTGVLICRPIQASWDTEVQGTCGNQTVAYVIIEIGGLIIDLAILAIPIRSILHLSLNTRGKIRFILIFSAGAVYVLSMPGYRLVIDTTNHRVTIITGFRIAALHRVNSSDFSYDQGYLGLLSTLGALLGITSCCAIYFPAFINYLSPRSKRTSQRTDNREVKPSSNHNEENKWVEYQSLEEEESNV